MMNIKRRRGSYAFKRSAVLALPVAITPFELNVLLFAYLDSYLGEGRPFLPGVRLMS